MNLRKHARLIARARALLVRRIEQGLRVEEAAQAAGVDLVATGEQRIEQRFAGEVVVGADLPALEDRPQALITPWYQSS